MATRLAGPPSVPAPPDPPSPAPVPPLDRAGAPPEEALAELAAEARAGRAGRRRLALAAAAELRFSATAEAAAAAPPLTRDRERLRGLVERAFRACEREDGVRMSERTKQIDPALNCPGRQRRQTFELSEGSKIEQPFHRQCLLRHR